jgi:2-polyprenyl-3-methyl-5-hydroxy-6-metoxy-1,4-benzoquinol methylase
MSEITRTSNVESGIHDERLREARVHGYETPRRDVQALVPTSARRILELGCSVGALGGALKRRQECYVVGVEVSEDYAVEARQRLDKVLVGDAQSVLDGEIGEEPFDCLVAADVLEHLVDPWATLRSAADRLGPGATAVISLPNVLHFEGLSRILRGRRWPLDDEGVFDRTHLRWFAPRDMEELVRQAGLEPVRWDPQYWKGGNRLRLIQMLAKTPLAPFLAPQYVIAARKT